MTTEQCRQFYLDHQFVLGLRVNMVLGWATGAAIWVGWVL